MIETILEAPILEARDLHKRFAEKLVLTGLDWKVPRGSIVGLLGRNGAGKTTLLKLMLGLLRATRGSMKVLEEKPWNLSAEAKARIGYVPQEYRPYPWMSVREVLDYTGAFYPNWNRALIDRLLQEWELAADDNAGTLSPGQRQKLGLLASLGHEPELLILDEPVASLDPAARRAFLRNLIELASDGTHTVVFSTHIVSDLERVADRVSILREGKIVYDDELDTLKERVLRLRIVASTDLPVDLEVPGTLRAEVYGREAMVSVLSQDGDLPRALERRFDASVQVQHLNLEDIFVEMSHV